MEIKIIIKYARERGSERMREKIRECGKGEFEIEYERARERERERSRSKFLTILPECFAHFFFFRLRQKNGPIHRTRYNYYDIF